MHRDPGAMSGHVPKFGAPNAGNFTEVFTLARGGGKAGSGDSAASQPEESNAGPVYSGRAASGGRAAAAAAAPRRGGDTGSTRSSQEGSLGSNKPSPPARREPRDPSSRGRSQDGSSKGARSNHPPRNINEEYAGASHLPKFGEWNGGDGETNYTVMFSAASKERKTGVAVDDAPMKGSGDSYSNSSRLPKKQSSCWPCF